MFMDAYKTGQFIKQLRTERNLSQYQLADLVPITRQAVSKWERGVSLPDSSTLLILAKIFDVSVDELLIGERLNKGNQEKVEEVKLQMVDENISKGKKIKRVILINIITITLLVLLFFIYYFINSYNSIKFYNVKGRGEVFTQSKGLLIFTKQKIYFQSGKLKYDEDNIKINEIKLYCLINKKNKLLYSTKNTDFLLIDYYGYNLLFDYKDIDKMKDNLYLEIIYNDNKKEKVKLEITNKFSNDNFLFSKLFSSVLNFNLEDTQKLKGILLTTPDSENKDEDKENVETKKDIKTDAKKNFSKNNEVLNNDKNISDSKNNEVDENDNSSKVNKIEEEYQKVLQYLENKDLFIEMIKKNFTLEEDEYNMTYSKYYERDKMHIEFSYSEASNYFNIVISSVDKNYECFWLLDYDMIDLKIFENEKLTNELYITKNDISSKNEKYQLLANIIFEYLNLFLN